MSATIPDMVKLYVELRDRKREITRRYRDAVGKLERAMADIEGRLLGELGALNVEGLKTPYGTVSTQDKQFPVVDDWDKVLTYIENNGAYDLLQRRIANARAVEMLQEGPIPGLRLSTRKVLTIRK